MSLKAQLRQNILPKVQMVTCRLPKDFSRFTATCRGFSDDQLSRCQKRVPCGTQRTPAPPYAYMSTQTRNNGAPSTTTPFLSVYPYGILIHINLFTASCS